MSWTKSRDVRKDLGQQFFDIYDLAGDIISFEPIGGDLEDCDAIQVVFDSGASRNSVVDKGVKFFIKKVAKLLKDLADNLELNDWTRRHANLVRNQGISFYQASQGNIPDSLHPDIKVIPEHIVLN